MTAKQNEYWFRLKKYGYGIELIHWKGLMVIGIYVATMLGVAYAFILSLRITGGEMMPRGVVMFGVSTIALNVMIGWLCLLKTEGEWRWRWGKRD